MQSRKELRGQLALAEQQELRLQKSLSALYTALSTANAQASTVERQSILSNQQMVDAAETPKKRAAHLKQQVKDIESMITECQAHQADIKSKLLGN